MKINFELKLNWKWIRREIGIILRVSAISFRSFFSLFTPGFPSRLNRKVRQKDNRNEWKLLDAAVILFLSAVYRYFHWMQTNDSRDLAAKMIFFEYWNPCWAEECENISLFGNFVRARVLSSSFRATYAINRWTLRIDGFRSCARREALWKPLKSWVVGESAVDVSAWKFQPKL